MTDPVIHVHGVEVPDMVDADDLVSEVIVLTKCVDSEGHARLAHSFSAGLSTWEALGIARSLVLTLERDLLDSTEDGE